MILMVYPRHCDYPIPVSTPLSILYPGAYLEQHGIPVTYYDQRIHPPQRLLQALAQRPLAVGISAKPSRQIGYAVQLARLIRRLAPDTPLIWGGPLPSLVPEQTVASPWVDFVVRREGEATLLALVQALATGRRDGEGIPGLTWKRHGVAVHNADRPLLTWEEIGRPYVGEARRVLEEYIAADRDDFSVSVQASRGCCHRCAFCYSSVIHGGCVREKPIAMLREELQLVRDLGGRTVTFVDDNLAPSAKRLGEICACVGASGMRWQAELSLNFVEAQSVPMLEQSGCSWLVFGLETYSAARLSRLNVRKVARSEFRHKIDLLRQTRIRRLYSMIVGFPGDTRMAIIRTMATARMLHRWDPAAQIAVQPYVPIPCTPLYAAALAAGFVPPARLPDWERHVPDETDRTRSPFSPFLTRLYLIATLAYRGERFLDEHFWSRRLASVARWRFRTGHFRWVPEHHLFQLYKRLWRLWHYLRFAVAGFAGPGLAQRLRN